MLIFCVLPIVSLWIRIAGPTFHISGYMAVRKRRAMLIQDYVPVCTYTLAYSFMHTGRATVVDFGSYCCKETTCLCFQ